MERALEGEIKKDFPEATLWLAVIDQAIDDLSDPTKHQAATDWFTSAAQGPGSFRWACDHLDLNHAAVWAALSKADFPQAINNSDASKKEILDEKRY